MNISDIELLWKKCLLEVLDFQLKPSYLRGLSKQTYDSIRRILVYDSYGLRARIADQKGLPCSYSSNPFVLSQRQSIPTVDRVWNIYLATYFGKHHVSEWKIYRRVSFDNSNDLITVADIEQNRDEYFTALSNKNIFDGASYSNHRKYTKKSIFDRGGFAISADYFLDNIFLFCEQGESDFESVYLSSLRIPSFGRMAAFDFACSLVKCKFPVHQPQSMYLRQSTGPLNGFLYLLSLIITNPSKNDAIILGDEIQLWFADNSEISMLAQVLEDAICNWQKNPESTLTYFG